MQTNHSRTTNHHNHMSYTLPSNVHFWADCSSHLIADLSQQGAIAVLPVAAIEQHGPHLPTHVDTALVNGMLTASFAYTQHTVPALILPTQAIGYSPEHSAFAGTLSFSAQTVLQLWTEIAECIAASGIRKLLIFNAHGGNVGLLDVVARDLRARLGLLVYTCSWFNLPLGAAGAAFSPDEWRFGAHAGAIETSLMLALHPAQVRMDLAQNFASQSQHYASQYDIIGNGRSTKRAWNIEDYNPQGAVGNASAASAEKGQALLEAIGRSLATVLCEIERMPPIALQNTTPSAALDTD